MNRINRFANNRPLMFSLVITILFIVLVLISSILVSSRWQGDTTGWYLGSTIGRLVAIGILLWIVASFGWLGPAGFTRLGGWQAWLVCLLALAYFIPLSAYVMTGNLNFSTSDPALTGYAAVFILIHAFLEEIAFRGLILYALVRAWNSTDRSLTKSVLVSSLFFAGYHIIYILGEPLPVVLLRVVVAFLLGVFLGALVLREKSIYPAVIFHGLTNFAAYLNLTSNATQGTTTGWMWLGIVMLPLAIFGLYWLRNVPQRTIVPEIA